MVKETTLSQVLHFWILGIKHIQTLGLQCLYKAKQQLSFEKQKGSVDLSAFIAHLTG